MSKFKIDDYIAHLSIDCVVFGYTDKQLKVLISKFKYGDELWGLPGGYIAKNESIDMAALRILQEKTHLSNIFLEQFRVFGDENRIIKSEHKHRIESELNKFDQNLFNKETIAWMTSRFVCIGFYALVNIENVNPQPGLLEERLEWRNIKELPEMTHDHNRIATCALNALRVDFDRKLTAFNLLPEVFTMKELQELYEAVYDRAFARNNFHKKITEMNVLDRLDKKFTGAANKAPYLYRFRAQHFRPL